MKNNLPPDFKAEHCEMCGAVSGDFWETKRTQTVTLNSQPRTGDLTHYWTICDECSNGLSNNTLPKPARIQLLTQIRRATVNDQTAVLDWLLRKFNLSAEKL